MAHTQSPSPGKSASKAGTAAESASIKTADSSSSASCCGKAASSFYGATEDSLSQENNLGHLIKNVYASINRMIDQGAAPLGLTAMQWKPLVMMRYRDIDTSAELSRATNVDTGAMTRTLDRLEAKGFVTRHRCQEDRRVVKLELTDSGTQVVESILPTLALALNTHLEGFSQQEVETLLGFLRRMIANGACTNAPSDPDIR